MNEIRRQIKELRTARRKAHVGLTREWDETQYHPRLSQLRDACEHQSLVTVMMVTGQYARVRCCDCGREVWHGRVVDMPSEYDNVRMSDF